MVLVKNIEFLKDSHMIQQIQQTFWKTALMTNFSNVPNTVGGPTESLFRHIAGVFRGLMDIKLKNLVFWGLSSNSTKQINPHLNNFASRWPCQAALVIQFVISSDYRQTPDSWSIKSKRKIKIKRTCRLVAWKTTMCPSCKTPTAVKTSPTENTTNV